MSTTVGPAGRTRRPAGAFFVAPSVIILFLWMIVPLALTIWFSFQRWLLLDPSVRGFNGLDNYAFLVSDPDFWVSLENTLILVGAVLAITVVLGTLLAVLFNQSFPGRSIARILAISPFFVMPTVSALVWKNMMLHPVYGVVGALFRGLGLPVPDLFADCPLASIIAIVSWEWLPYALLVLLTAVQSMDAEQREAARVDGAGPIATFFYLTLPHLSRAISVVIMIETIFLLTIFAEIFVTTNGGPGNASTNLAYLIFRAALQDFDAGSASAGGMVAVVLANIVAIFLVRTVARQLGGLSMEQTKSQRVLATILGWGAALLMFFPVLWTLITSFKSENDAIRADLNFVPTLEGYRDVFARADYLGFALNSVAIAVGGTLLALAFAVPAAYSMAFYPTKRTRGTLLWMLSTKMMPAVAVLFPMYYLFLNAGLLDTRTGLIIINALTNLPIVVWMLYTFNKDVPIAILEAGRVDGVRIWGEIRHILLPLTLPGIAATSLLSVILCWNEAFWSLNLSGAHAGPLTAFIASFSSPEGLFFAKLSAASTMAVAPILVFGWFSQKQLVQGLTFGAVK